MTNTNYEKLQIIIRKSDPEKFGLVDPHSAPSTYKYKYNRCGDCFCSIQETHSHYLKDISLADVLFAGIGKIHDIEVNENLVQTFKLLENGEHTLKTFWNLYSADNLDDQSEETKLFLIDLLCQN